MNLWKGLKGIPRNIWLISAGTLINRMGMMVLPFLILYLTQEMGESPGKAGLVLTFYGLGALISAPFAGKLSDKIGPLNLMRISLILSGLLLFIYPMLTDYWSIAVLSVILAVVTEAFRPASLAFVSDEAPEDLRKPAFALYRLAINLGMSIGPVAGGFLAAVDFSLLFYVDGITSIAAGIYLIIAKWDALKTHLVSEEGNEKNTNLEIIPPYRNWKFIYFLLATVPVVMVFFQHMSSMPLFVVEELGYARSTFGIFVSVNTVIIILVEVPLNTAMNNWKDWKLLTLGCLLTGIGFGLMAVLTSLPGLVITIIIWTFGEMIFFPVAASYVAELSPQEKRGEYMGWFQMVFSGCLTVAPWLGTTIFEIYGSVTLWTWTFIAGFTSTVMFLKFRKN
jgi:MFS family permease